MRALIYTRVSTEDQDERLTHESQLREAREYCQKHAYEVVKVAHEQQTGGEFWERAVLSAERERIRQGDYDVFLVHSVERLSRDIAHLFIVYDECRRAGVRLEFVTVKFEDSPEGKLLFAFNGYYAESERLRIRERMVRGKRQRVVRGKLINASTPLYGYRQDRTTSARTIYEPEAAIVRRIWSLALAGIGQRSIAQKLNAEGVPCPAQGKRIFKDSRSPRWGKSTIARILAEPAYAGLSVAYRWHHEKRNGKQTVRERPRAEWVILPSELTPAIIPPEQFDQLAAQSRTGDTTRNAERFSLLRGLIFCGRCGHRRQVEPTGYRCGSRDLQAGRCGSPSTPRQAVERWAWEWVEARLRNPAELAAELARHPAADDDRASLEQRAAELDARWQQLTQQQKRLVDHFAEAGDELAAMVQAKIRTIEQEKRNLQPERESLRRRLTSNTERRESAQAIAERFSPAALTPEYQRAILQGLGVRVMTDGREGWRVEFG